MWIVVFTFLLVTFFDTTGTLIGLVQQAGLMKDNKMPRAGEALAADSSGMLVGSVLGTSPVGAFVESSSGIAVGGRTGFNCRLGWYFLPYFNYLQSNFECFHYPSYSTRFNYCWGINGRKLGTRSLD